MGRKLTIRDMVLFIFMPVLLAAVLLCGGISYFLIRRQIQDNTFSNALDIVTQLQMNLDYRLGDVESALTGLAHSGQVLALLQQGEDFSQDEALQRLLEDIVVKFPFCHRVISPFGPLGLVVGRAPRPTGHECPGAHETAGS